MLELSFCQCFFTCSIPRAPFRSNHYVSRCATEAKIVRFHVPWSGPNLALLILAGFNFELSWGSGCLVAGIPFFLFCQMAGKGNACLCCGCLVPGWFGPNLSRPAPTIKTLRFQTGALLAENRHPHPTRNNMLLYTKTNAYHRNIADHP